MIIAQITDVHLGFDRADPDELNTRRAKATVEHLLALEPSPTLVIVSGDLTEHGDAASYDRLKSLLSALPMPVYVAVGNHDSRPSFRSAFPDVPAPDGFIQYAIELDDWRLIVLDTLDEGRAGGAFCPQRATWLDDTLAGAPDRATLLVLHHPPFAIGIDWMDPIGEPDWIARLRDVVRRHPQVRALAAGHVHRAAMTVWEGRAACVVSSVAPQLALDLAPVDPRQPDGRPLVVAEAPAFALHRLQADGTIVTHFGRAAEAPVILRLDRHVAPAIAALKYEGVGPELLEPGV